MSPRCSVLATPDLGAKAGPVVAVATSRARALGFELWGINMANATMNPVIVRNPNHPMIFPMGGTVQSMSGIECLGNGELSVWAAAG